MVLDQHNPTLPAQQRQAADCTAEADQGGFKDQHPFVRIFEHGEQGIGIRQTIHDDQVRAVGELFGQPLHGPRRGLGRQAVVGSVGVDCNAG